MALGLPSILGNMMRDFLGRHPYLTSLWVGGVLIAIGLVLAGVFIQQNAQQQKLFVPKHVADTVPFPIYYANALPLTYVIDTQSYRYEEGILSFRLTSPTKKAILITEQAPPKGLDIDQVVIDRLKKPQAVVTQYGKAVIGNQEDTKGASLRASKTWIFISTPASTSTADLSALLDGLRLQP
jgi:hypothetical protein